MKKLPKYSDHKDHIYQMIDAAVSAVDPYFCTQKYLAIEGDHLSVGDQLFDLGSGRLFVVAIGKAAVPMTNGVLDILGKFVASGVAITKKGQSNKVENRAVETFFAAHPVPDESSIIAADAAIDLLCKTTPKDLVLFLISGGASALCTKPMLGLSDWRSLSQDLLASGCSIQEFNTVRKQLDSVKGGGLGEMAAPAKIMTLVLSDVIGNPIDMIGSGPTVPNLQTPADALAILKKYQIQNMAAIEILNQLSQTQIEFESPFEFVGDLSIACNAASVVATDLGYRTEIMTTELEGEAAEVGRKAAEIAKGLQLGTCMILGGETTVTLEGDGIGGRNQELALSASIELEGDPDLVVATYATDGDDGPTEAAVR